MQVHNNSITLTLGETKQFKAEPETLLRREVRRAARRLSREFAREIDVYDNTGTTLCSIKAEPQQALVLEGAPERVREIVAVYRDDFDLNVVDTGSALVVIGDRAAVIVLVRELVKVGAAFDRYVGKKGDQQMPEYKPQPAAVVVPFPLDCRSSFETLAARADLNLTLARTDSGALIFTGEAYGILAVVGVCHAHGLLYTRYAQVAA